MKILCLSDLHGNLPENLPEHDIMVVGGDSEPVWDHDVYFQALWTIDTFIPWLESYQSEKVVVFGNHSIYAEDRPDLIPDRLKEYLLHESCCILKSGISFYGTPHSLPFFPEHWVFNRTEEQLEEIYSKVPVGIDVIVSHGPPKGYLDLVPYRGGENTGSQALVDMIDRVKPKLCTVGHIHDQYGYQYRNETLIVNCSLLNDKYKMVNKPLLIDTDTWKFI